MSEELKEITRLCGVIKEKDKENRRLYIALRNREQEIERLNNIIDELEKELDLNLPFKVVGVRHLKNKLQELKGSNKDNV